MGEPAPALGSVFLTDFGLAKNTVTGSRYTRTGETLGTPHYMSPEQARGELSALDARSDVWALGCILHELVRGTPPFDGDTVAAIIAQVIGGRPPDLLAGRPDLPPALRRLWGACLARSPRARPRSAAAVAADCRRLLRGETPHARPPRRWGWLAPAAAAAGLTLVAAGVWAFGAPAAPTAARAPTEAEARAAHAWDLRGSDVRAGAALLAGVLARHPDRHDWRLRHGLLLWSAGDGAAAKTQWARVPDGTPQAPLARLYAAFVQFFTWDQTGFRTEPARPALQALRDTPGRVGRLARAALCISNDADAAALTELQGVQGWEASYLRALAIAELTPVDRDRELAAYDEALGTGVRFAWALNNRGLAHHAAGHVPAAIADFTAALELEPAFRAAWINRGVAYETSRDLVRAIADYRAAVALNGRDPIARFNLANIYLAQHNYDAAIAAFGEVLAIDAAYLPALVNRATAYQNRGHARAAAGDAAGAQADWQAAIAHFTRAVTADPAHESAWLDRGRLRFMLGDRRRALQDMDRAVAAHPRSAPARNNRGLLRAMSGDAAGAKADFDAALAADPDHVDARYNRGTWYLAHGDRPRARADFLGVLDRQPEHTRALIARGRLRLLDHDLDGALADFDLAARVNPKFADAYLKRSIVHTQQNKLALARADLDRCIALDERLEDAWYNRGIVRKLQGDLAGAVADWRHALQIAPPRWPRRAKAEAFARQIEAKLQAAGR